MRVLYFTAGNVGAGHLVRGLAIGRGLARAGFRGDYRMLGPALPFPLPPAYETIEISPREVLLREKARGSALAAALERLAPDLLLVDLFWPPLRWLLPRAGTKAWLLVRRPSYADWFQGPPMAPFEPSLFERVVTIEPCAEAPATDAIDPVVVCNPDELRPPGSLRARLGVGAGERLVAVVHAGKPGQIEEVAAAAPEGRRVRFDLHAPGALFPLCEWLADADHVVCGAGYNSFWEAHWLGWAARTTFVALAPHEQGGRLAQCLGHRPRVNGADVLARWIAAS